jgi:hypothetical protein
VVIADALAAHLWPISSRLRRQESCYRMPDAVRKWTVPAHPGLLDPDCAPVQRLRRLDSGQGQDLVN